MGKTDGRKKSKTDAHLKWKLLGEQGKSEQEEEWLGAEEGAQEALWAKGIPAYLGHFLSDGGIDWRVPEELEGRDPCDAMELGVRTGKNADTS
ncbi:hypothetical protein HGM15179_011031 [Zosterops borbonicus]|uniref:Uncharacterized protein n=1 Tax=Zosterops borbonicus TaxID=364589 RepID=A0A8K1GDY1_9PASS|nr:hypothetical protein HGM15179_011031 [Zosterops borbonicus]